MSSRKVRRKERKWLSRVLSADTPVIPIDPRIALFPHRSVFHSDFHPGTDKCLYIHNKTARPHTAWYLEHTSPRLMYYNAKMIISWCVRPVRGVKVKQPIPILILEFFERFEQKLLLIFVQWTKLFTMSTDEHHRSIEESVLWRRRNWPPTRTKEYTLSEQTRACSTAKKPGARVSYPCVHLSWSLSSRLYYYLLETSLLFNFFSFFVN